MTNVDKLDMDTSSTIHRINAATEKKYKDSGVKVTFKEPENLIFIEGFKETA